MRFSITSQRKREGESNLMETDEVMPVQGHITACAHRAMMQTLLPPKPGRAAQLPSPQLKLFSRCRGKMHHQHAGSVERVCVAGFSLSSPLHPFDPTALLSTPSDPHGSLTDSQHTTESIASPQTMCRAPSTTRSAYGYADAREVTPGKSKGN